MVEGGSIPVCVRTDGDLRKEVHLILYTTGKVICIVYIHVRLNFLAYTYIRRWRGWYDLKT